MNKKEEKKEEYFNPHPFSFIPPPYKLTGSLIPLAHALFCKVTKLPHPNSKSYVAVELVGNEASSSESIV